MALTRAELIAAGIVIPGSTSAQSFIPTGNTVPSNGLYLSTTNTVAIATNSVGKLFIDANGRINQGTVAAFFAKDHTNTSKTVQFQSARTGETVFNLASFEFGFDSGGSLLSFTKSRSPDPTNFIYLANNQTIGKIVFSGDDGFGFTPGAAIVSTTDQASGITAPNMVAGTSYKIYSVGTSNFTLVGAASNTVGTVFTATGSTTGSGEVVPANGTTAANLRFMTTPFGSSFPQERLRITSSGSIGVGTTSPSALFHLNSGGNTELLVSSTFSGSLETAIRINTVGDASRANIYFSKSSTIRGSIQYHHNVNGGAERLQLSPAGSTGLNVLGSGNVGIGSLSPAYKLHVVDSVDGSVILQVLNSYSGAGTANNAIVSCANTNNYFNMQLLGQQNFALLATNSQYTLYRSPIHVFQDSAGTTEYGRFDGSGRLLVGASSQLTSVGSIKQEVVGGSLAISTFVGNAFAYSLPFTKSRGSSVGTIVQSGDELGNIDWYGDDGSATAKQAARIQAFVDGTPGANAMPGRIVFSTNSGTVGAYPTPRMTIGNNGTTGIGYTPNTDYRLGVRGGSAENAVIGSDSTRAQGSGWYNFYGTSDSATVLQSFIRGDGIYGSRTSTYGGLSDARLKENVVDAQSQWGDVKSIRFRNFNLIGDSTRQLGVIAQEIEQISPGLVDEINDRDEQGNETGTSTKLVKYSILYMKAVKALQEAMERIEQLEAKVAALESN